MTNHNPIRGDAMTMATRELSAFFSAVTELFGSEQAEASAEDWLHELTASNDLPASTREWRTLTLTAAARLARRVNAWEERE
jgi:alkylhydroperoxidase/carboxymuconolactone decarboxylase family protein YurZ